MPKALPNRKNIVLTKNKNFLAEGALIANTLEESLELVGKDLKPFIIGGGEIYTLFLPIADKIELTRVHETFEGDAFFPEIDLNKWELFWKEKHFSSSDKIYDYSYLTYKKITS